MSDLGIVLLTAAVSGILVCLFALIPFLLLAKWLDKEK